MKHLQKITISNIRRFSENVEIAIGEGATIFLAPNGTGKTALFEAIELALTGKVKRLITPEPLIKDNCLTASIRLDFDQEEFCEALFNKGSLPIISGNHASLFGKVEEQDIPFLLQLTHFLNQRGDNWFVQAGSEIAGSQLDHLSIGREAAEVNRKIPSAKKAARNLFEQAQKEFNDANLRLTGWLTLLDRRNGSNLQIENILITKTSLLERINQVVIQIKDQKPSADERILSMKARLGEVQVMAQAILDNFKKREIVLESLDVVVSDFGVSQNTVTKLKAHLEDLQKNKLSADAENARLKKEIEGQLAKILSVSNEVGNQRKIKFEIDNLNRLNREINALITSLPNIENEIKLNTEIHQEAKKRLDDVRDLVIRHEGLEKKDKLIINELDRINSYRNFHNSLIENNEQLFINYNITLPLILVNVNEQQSKLLELTQSKTRLENSVKQFQLTFDTLNSATDEIKAAIGVIISGYPSDKGDCPVCGEVYSASELRIRMERALNMIDPNLSSAADNLETSKSSLNALIMSVQLVERDLNDAQKDLLWINQQISKFQDFETETLGRFPNCTTIEDALNIINELEKEITETRLNQFSTKSKLLPKPSAESILNLSNQVDIENGKLLKAIEALNLSNEKIIELTENKSTIEKLISDFGDVSGINELLIKLETDLNSAQNTLETLKRTQNNQQIIFENLSNEGTKIEITISQISTQISGLRAQWNQLRLSGDPSQVTLNDATVALKNSVSRWDKNLNDLTSVNAELARWQIIEDAEKVEDEIKASRGDIGEVDFGNSLEKVAEDNKIKLEVVTNKLQALNSFANNLEAELLTVHERIRTINPLWKKLLKRIVIDPRFAETTLDNYNYYKKQHANVFVPVGGNNTLVSQVASEAQLTDIQLTFLLAMAQKYQWSPWKALLLDDPTQHHDLVHASAVFDLLRDYISEHSFQILMATHDTVQAKFLLRKLQNDGIPVKLYTLFATDGGVNVKLNS